MESTLIDPDVLPRRFASWIGELAPGPLPRESYATCSSCAMCARAGDAPDPARIYFAPDVKCCSYLPELPNFLVGDILADPRLDLAQGRASIEARIAEGVAVTPLGLGAPESYVAMHRDRSDEFGRAHELLCPHFVVDGARCGIWRHREATCATWFCKHVRGARGESFWDAVRVWLLAVQGDVARWCVQQLFDGCAAEPGDPSGEPSPWGSWASREREFYIEAARCASLLSWDDLLEIGNAETELRAHAVRQAYERLVDVEIAPVLQRGSIEIVSSTQRTATIRTYSPLDPIELPSSIVDALVLFDGRTTAEARRAIAQERGVDLTRAQIRELVDFQILVPGNQGERAAV